MYPKVFLGILKYPEVPKVPESILKYSGIS